MFNCQNQTCIACMILYEYHIPGQGQHSTFEIISCFSSQLPWVGITGPVFFSEKISDVAVLINSALLSASGQCKAQELSKPILYSQV